ncbi:siroheme synthase CysG [Methylotuvimicrobium sp. KM2]|uniref:siroheme synthase CysG n=1 Tax=Methylotuvimicrobium sp. KM2 TaxID=3133976 RepID=UPI003100BB5F
MEFFPLFLNIKDHPCLVIGAGDIAARKIELLLRAGAKVVVVAPEIGEAVAALQDEHAIVIRRKAFTSDDIDGMRLVVSATNDRLSNAKAATLAKQRLVPVNVVDNLDLCSFIFPAIIDRSPLLIAVSSSGASPVLSRLLRAKIETAIPASFGLLAEFIATFKTRVALRIPQARRRLYFWETVMQGRVAELIFAGRQQEAESQLLAQLDHAGAADTPGEVYLIGTGPGDPDLLTFKALRLLRQADVIVYDNSVSGEILKLAHSDAETIFVGQQDDNHSLPPAAIHRQLAELASSGKKVARLKGGDPFIFGRGGEEIETLMQSGTHFQIVPGITAASACASYSGIPLTHRDHAQSCTFVSGHVQNGRIDLDWRQLAKPNQTVIIYMGMSGLESICRSLIDHGCPADLPIAVIQSGATHKQRVFIGTLSDRPAYSEFAESDAPALTIVGTVVNLHRQLNWFST